VVSGDLANRGRREQIEQATARLRSLGPKVVRGAGQPRPPLLLPGRFSHPWREFERQWATTEPIHRSEQLLVVGSTQPAPGASSPASCAAPHSSERPPTRRHAARGVPARLPASSSRLRALARAQSARSRAEGTCCAGWRKAASTWSPRAHPPVLDDRAARVRRRRRAQTTDLRNGARLRPPPAAPAGRGARAPALRLRRGRDQRRDVHLARG